MPPGVQWLEILRSLKASFGDTDLRAKISDGSLRQTFDKMDTDGSGALEVRGRLLLRCYSTGTPHLAACPFSRVGARVIVSN